MRITFFLHKIMQFQDLKNKILKDHWLIIIKDPTYFKEEFSSINVKKRRTEECVEMIEWD